MKMTILGSGTSHGIPCIACDCYVCTSKDPRDTRLRCSAFVELENGFGKNTSILIDIGPEFRIQAIKHRIKKIDAVLLTHSHADHLHGLDDIRIFSHTMSSSFLKNPNIGKETEGPGIGIYSNNQSLRDVRYRFDYVFKDTQIGGGKPKLHLESDEIFMKDHPKEFGKIKVVPIPMKHGRLDTTGWLLSYVNDNGEKHSIAYLTDCSFISDESVDLINKNKGILDHCVIDALREEPHQTHFSYLQAMEIAERIEPEHTWLTHICHLKNHKEIQQYIDEHTGDFSNLSRIVKNGGSVEPAYDGLVLNA